MVRNSVVVNLSVRDEITGQLRGIRAQFEGLRTPIGGVDSGFRSLNSSAGNVAQTIKGWAIGIGATTLAIGGAMKLMGGFKDAMNSETSSLGAANGLAFSLKMNLKDAIAFNKEIDSKVTDSAMSLPGEAKDYKSVKDAISSTVAIAVGGDKEKFRATILPLTEKLTILGQGAVGGALPGSAIAMGANKFMTEGTGFKETMMSDSFEKVPVLKEAIKRIMTLRGITEKAFISLSTNARAEMLKAASNMAVTPEFIAEIRKTTGSTIGELMDTFFNPDKGIFGWLKDVKLPNSDKKTTTLQSLQSVFSSIQGITTVLKSVTGGMDVMQGLSDMFRSFSKTVRDATEIVKKGSMVCNDLTFLFTKKVSDSLTELSATIGKIDWKSIGFNFGDNIAKILLDPKLGISLEKVVTEALNGLGAAIFEAIRSSGSQFLQWMDKNVRVPNFNGVMPAKPGELPAGTMPAAKVNKILGIGTPPPNAKRPWGTIGGDEYYKDKPQSSLPSIGGSKGQQVAYNTVTINGANMSDGAIVAAVNREWGAKQARVMA